MIAEQINNFFLKQVVVILLLIVFASVTYAEDSLQEQEFQTIETEKIQIENEKDFSYVISSLPTQINTSSNFVLYNLKNEYY